MKYIKGFDGLRAISIMLVIFTHLDLYNRLPKSEFVQTRLWHLISGDTGVMVFFVLSGFLITSILLAEKAKTGTIKLRAFFARRFIRLLPALIVFYAMLSFAVIFDYVTMPIEGVLYAVFYLYNFVPNQFYTYELGHFWSLSLEEQFYFSWPFALLFLQKLRNYLILFTIILALCVFAYFTFESNPAFINYKPVRFFIPAITPILFGCAGGLVNHFYSIQVTKFFTKSFLTLAFFLALFPTLISFPLFAPTILFPVIQVFQSFGVILFLLWIFHHQDSIIVSLLEFAPIKYIGTISYGLYVFQGFFLRTGGGGEAWIHHTPWNIVLTFVFAIGTYEIIERKTLKIKDRFKSIR